MDARRRDSAIEQLLSRANSNQQKYLPMVGSLEVEALTECHAKAKAWDKHHSWVANNAALGINSLIEALEYMDSLVPPESTTALGKLKKWAEKAAKSWPSFPSHVAVSDPLNEISQIEKEERDKT